MSLKGLSTVLQVNDMGSTIMYYEKTLGFRCHSRMGDDWASVERDNVSIMLSCRYGEDKDKKTRMTGSLYIFTNPVEDLWLELKDKAEIFYPIETFDYGMREFAIIDCNGYILQFGQGIEKE